MTRVISQISDEQLALLKKAWLKSFDNSSRFGTREEVEELVSRFYSYNGLESPIVFWCQSPLQVMYFHLLLELFSHSSSFLSSVRQLADLAPTKQWSSLWKHVLSEVERVKLTTPELLDIYRQSRQTPGKSILYDRLVQGSYISSFCKQDLCFESRLSGKLLNQLGQDYESLTGVGLPETNNGASLQNNGRNNRVVQFFELMTRNVNFRLELMKQIPSNVKEELRPYALSKISSPLVEDSRELLARAINQDAESDLGLWWGIWSAGYMPFYAKLIEVLEFDMHDDKSLARTAKLYSDLSEKTFCIGFSRNFCFVCEPPKILSFNESSFHSTVGPAIKLQDNSELHALYGVPVNKELIDGLDDIDAKFIYGTRNIEIRRALMRFYGEDRFLQEMVAQVLDSDDTGTLYMVEFDNDEPLVMVKVRNSTAEPDGSYKDYFLRVPPFMRYAKDAVAWTFGLDSEEYEPVVET